jgi:serine/threonine protein kinase/Tfp pilus assembly protein PilF
MIGRTVSHYRIESELGAGGMGVVYKAIDLRLGRSVALKFLPPDLTRPAEAKERFIREAQSASSLDHPNICTIYEFDETDDRQLFFAMACYEGETLRTRLARERLSVDEALDVVTQVTRGLGKAHQKGIIHRDIKPANLMITSDGVVKILDFGLAKLGGDRTLTREGSTVGSPPYMSPEQVSGRTLDHRTDIWSLGVVLYQSLTGTLPFQGENDRVLFHAILEQPVPPTGRRPLDRIIEKCLAKDVDRRYGDASELAEDLRLAAAELSDPAVRSTTVAKAETVECSIAILPFADMSPGRDQDYFCEGVAEEILNSLTHIDGLRVASRTSSFQFKGSAQDIRRIGEQLRVTTILEGSVRKAGERLRVTVQLIGTADGYHLWSKRYDGKLDDIFEIQDEIAEQTAHALEPLFRGRLQGAPKAQRTEIEAYDYYLRGRQYFVGLRQRSLELAREMFERSAAIDPQYSLALTGIADASSWLFMWFGGRESDVKKAEEASRQAIALTPDLAEAHVSRGLALLAGRRHEEAAHEFQVALDRNPNLFDGWYSYGRTRFAQGRFEEAAELSLKAAEVRADDYQSLGIAAMAFRRLDLQERFRQAAEEALRRTERRLEIDPNDSRALYLGADHLLLLGRERDRAEAMIARSLEIDPEDGIVLYNAACFYALAGEPEKSLDWLERAAEQHGFSLSDWIANDPDMDAVRDHPRFQEIVSRMR